MRKKQRHKALLAKGKANDVCDNGVRTYNIFEGNGVKGKPKARKYKKKTDIRMLESGENLHLDSYKNQRYKKKRDKTNYVRENGQLVGIVPNFK